MTLLRALVVMTVSAVALTLPIAIALAACVIVFRALVTSGCGS